MTPVRAVRRIFWDPPEESLLQTGAAGELLIAKARVGLTTVLLILAVLAYLKAPGAPEPRIHLAGGLLAVLREWGLAEWQSAGRALSDLRWPVGNQITKGERHD